MKVESFRILGREIQKDSYGLNNRKKSVYTEYYTTGTNNGKLYRVSEPCFEEGNPVWAATYAYDTYGRPSTVITPAGTTSYTYDGLTTIITSPGDTVSTTLNSTGLAQSITTNGKTVSYTYYSTGAVKTATPQGGQPISMEYDIQGNRTKLTDPDAGVIESGYNGFGELVWIKQNVHHRADSLHLSSDTVLVTHNYAPTTGLLQSIVRTGKSTETTLYTYDPVHKSRVVEIEIPGQHKQTFSYDALGRITNVHEEIGTKVFERSTTYDAFGRPRKETFPSGYYVLNTYDNNGYLTRVDDQNNRLVWEALTENARGQLLTEKKGNKTTTYAYDSRGLPSSILAPGIVNLSYAFTNEGNLLYREDNLYYQKEVFIYDGLNRLTGWDIYDDSSIPNEEHSIVYHPTTGNIESKTDLRIDMEPCTLSYNADGKPHALAAVSNAPDYISAENLTVTYTDFRKINTLTEGNKTYTLTYGVDDQRRKSVFTQGAATTTRYYLGDYEEVQKSDGTIQKIHYLRGGSMMLQQGATKSLYYGYHDYQGSLIAWTNQSGTVVERRAYDPWGRHRNPQSWTEVDYTSTSWLNNRGYTGHEHLDAFQIINMNGRVYDPLTAQFFSPDPFVQAPDNWLNYNRYGYCLNNPFKYTDPSGDFFYIIPNIGWSPQGGLSIGVSFVVGIPGVVSAQAGIGYSFKSNDLYGSAGVTAALNTLYVSASTNSGFSAGYSFGFTPFSGVPISTNITSVGVNYNISNDSWSGNVSALQVDNSGMTFNPSVSAMIYPEQTTNFVRGKGWNDNDAVLSNYKAGKYNLKGHTWQDAALDYFGFKGSYDSELSSEGHCDENGVITYSPNAFVNGFDYLNRVAAEEMYHSRDVGRGTYDDVDWNDQYQKAMAQAEGEYKANKFLYHRSGLFKAANKDDLCNRITRHGNVYGAFDKYLTPNNYYYNFTYKWWHCIYNIPKKW